MAGDKQPIPTPIKEAPSTPAPKTDGVKTPVEFAKLVSYIVNVRSFHPNQKFEKGGFRFHGDNRGFSTGPSFFLEKAPAGAATSRVWQRYCLDTASLPTGDLTKNKTASLTTQSNPSGPGPWGWSMLGHEEDYQDEDLRPSGKLSAIIAENVHGGQKQIAVKSWYGGKNHAFLLSTTLHKTTGWTPVPTLDAFSDLSMRIERVNRYIDIETIVYGDGFPNCEAFIQDPSGKRLVLGTHVRYGIPATHLAGENQRLMWANAIRVGIDANGNFTDKLWIHARVLGGPTDLRDEYLTSGQGMVVNGDKISGEVCRIGAKPALYDNPFSDRPTRFIWDCGNVKHISRRPAVALPIYLSAFVDIEEVRAQLKLVWEAGPVAQTTVSAWNDMHLHRNPNEGRSPDSYDVEASRWRKPN